MRATNRLEGSASVSLSRRRRGDGSKGLTDLCRVLDATLCLLARELDVLADGTSPDGARELRRIRMLTEDVLRRLRAVSHDDEPIRGWSALASCLRKLGADFARATGASVELQVVGSPERIPDEAVEVIFGVACEAFRSVERHARASLVLVVLSVHGSSVVLEVKDDGLDLAHREAYDWSGGTRTGLLTAAALVESVGGRLVLTPTPPRGLRLVAEVPCLPPVA